jgi:transposase InsO family protein
VVLDYFSRRVGDWAMAEHKRAELVVEALEMAVGAASPSPGSSTTRTVRLLGCGWDRAV